MKKFLLGTVLVALAGPAFAADMPLKAPPPAVAMAYNWSGFYIGGSAGYMLSHTDNNFITPPIATWHIDQQAGLLDGHVGAQVQFTNIVVGVEGDFIGSFSQQGTADVCHPVGACAPTGAVMNGQFVDHMWTVGGRAGLIGGTALFYVSGGYAGDARFQNGFANAPGTAFAQLQSTTTTHNGAYIGAGFDWMVYQGLIFGAEYRHYNFNSVTATPISAVTGLPVVANTWTVAPQADTLSIRLSWLFGGWGGMH